MACHSFKRTLYLPENAGSMTRYHAAELASQARTAAQLAY